MLYCHHVKYLIFYLHPLTFPSQVVSYLSCFFISLSIAAFCVSTLPGIRTEETIMGSPYWLSLLELVCSSFFTLEFLMRLIFCPNKLLFFKRPMNWIDLISILPFYVSQVSDDDKVKMFLVIRVLRLFRYVVNKRENQSILRPLYRRPKFDPKNTTLVLYLSV